MFDYKDDFCCFSCKLFLSVDKQKVLLLKQHEMECAYTLKYFIQLHCLSHYNYQLIHSQLNCDYPPPTCHSEYPLWYCIMAHYKFQSPLVSVDDHIVQLAEQFHSDPRT